jgi:hypothetical protein
MMGKRGMSAVRGADRFLKKTRPESSKATALVLSRRNSGSGVRMVVESGR